MVPKFYLVRVVLSQTVDLEIKFFISKQPRITDINNEVKTIQHQLNELNRQKTEILSDNTNLKLQITGKIVLRLIK